MSKSSVIPDSVPVIQISLVPEQSGLSSELPAGPPPSPRFISRAMVMEVPLPSPSHSSQLLPPRRKSWNSTLKPPTTPETSALSPLSPSKKVLRDHQAANALIARTLTKMINPPSTLSSTFSTPQPAPPKLTSGKNKAAHSTLVAPSVRSEEATRASSSHAQQRVLVDRPRGGQQASGSKVEIIRFVKPAYPSVARDAGWEGTVIVRALIQTDGLPAEVNVQKSSGHSILDKAATKAIQQWRFDPEKDGNIPIAKYVDIPLKFELHSQ